MSYTIVYIDNIYIAHNIVAMAMSTSSAGRTEMRASFVRVPLDISRTVVTPQKIA